jgi:uncharacterized protein YcsI (UPF0317 family)
MTDDHPVPTNVTCQFSYDNGVVAYNNSVVIRHNKDIKRTHIYTTNGTKTSNVMIKSALVYESIRLSLVEILNPSTGFTTTTNWYSDDARDNAFLAVELIV